jgi:hypothetical protein
MATHGRKHLGTILVALVTAALTTGLMSALPGNAATTGGGSTPLGLVDAPRLLAGFHTVRSSETAVPTIDKWFNAVNGVEPTLSGPTEPRRPHAGQDWPSATHGASPTACRARASISCRGAWCEVDPSVDVTPVTEGPRCSHRGRPMPGAHGLSYQ